MSFIFIYYRFFSSSSFPPYESGNVYYLGELGGVATPVSHVKFNRVFLVSHTHLPRVRDILYYGIF